jgi:hypothetical protein
MTTIKQIPAKPKGACLASLSAERSLALSIQVIENASLSLRIGFVSHFSPQ